VISTSRRIGIFCGVSARPLKFERSAKSFPNQSLSKNSA
jgi:hypothetical protein